MKKNKLNLVAASPVPNPEQIALALLSVLSHPTGPVQSLASSTHKTSIVTKAWSVISPMVRKWRVRKRLREPKLRRRLMQRMLLLAREKTARPQAEND